MCCKAQPLEPFSLRNICQAQKDPKTAVGTPWFIRPPFSVTEKGQLRQLHMAGDPAGRSAGQGSRRARGQLPVWGRTHGSACYGPEKGDVTFGAESFCRAMRWGDCLERSISKGHRPLIGNFNYEGFLFRQQGVLAMARTNLSSEMPTWEGHTALLCQPMSTLYVEPQSWCL